MIRHDLLWQLLPPFLIKWAGSKVFFIVRQKIRRGKQKGLFYFYVPLKRASFFLMVVRSYPMHPLSYATAV